MDTDPVIQRDELIQPARGFAVLLGEVNGGDSTAVPVGEEAGRAADATTGIEHFVMVLDFGQLGQSAGGDSAERVEVLDRTQMLNMNLTEVFAGRDESLLDVLSGHAGRVLAVHLRCLHLSIPFFRCRCWYVTRCVLLFAGRRPISDLSEKGPLVSPTRPRIA